MSTIYYERKIFPIWPVVTALNFESKIK